MVIHAQPVTLDLSVIGTNMLGVLKTKAGKQSLFLRVLQPNFYQKNIKFIWARMEWKTPNLMLGASLKPQVVCQ